jgi:hypothetical protein
MRNKFLKFGKYPFEKPSPIPIANERNLEFERLQREVREVQRINAIHDSSLALARQVIKRIRDNVNEEMSRHRIIPATDPVSFEVRVILQNLRITFETFENIKAEKAAKDLLLQNQIVQRRLHNLRIRDEGVAEKARIMFETFYNLVFPVFNIYLMDTVLMEGIQNPNLLLSRSKEIAKYLELLVGFQEDLRRAERGVFTNINTSSFGMPGGGSLSFTDNYELPLQKIKQDNKFIKFIYKKIESASSKFSDKISTLNLPNTRDKLILEVLIYIRDLRNLYFDLVDRVVLGKGFELRKYQIELRRQSMGVLDATIDIFRTRLIQFAFGIVEITEQDHSIVEFHTTQKTIVDISELVTFFIRKFKQISDDTRDPRSLVKFTHAINRLIAEMLELLGMPQEIIMQI